MSVLSSSGVGVWLAWWVVTSAWVPAWGAPAGREVVATGKGFAILREELDQVVVEQKVVLQGMGRRLTREDEIQLEAETLERLVIRRMLLERAVAEDREEARARVDKGIAEQKALLGSDEAYRRQILRGGVQVEAFEARLHEQAVADQVITREWRDKVEVTDEQMRAFYERGVDVSARELEARVARLEQEDRGLASYREATNRLATLRQTNLDRLVRPEQARARMLVLFTKDPLTGRPLADETRQLKRERMERLRDRVTAGEDFAALAIEFSEEADAARNRAEYFAVKAKISLPELREAIFSLPLNQVSGVITTELGLYLIEVLARPPAGKVPFDEARSDIQALLERQEIEQRLPAWFEQLKREFEVEIVGKGGGGTPPKETRPT
jgi:parvulin-like peptidyl-prolyl isomerase